MRHYICTGGCGGVSNKYGVCQATDCPKHGKPLDECDCEDGKHAAAAPEPKEGTEAPER